MARKSALITGITGQDGSYLAEFLLEKGYEVHGLARRASTFNRSRIDHLFSDVNRPNLPISLHYGDLGDSSSLMRVIQAIKPHEVYNLAAQSHVGISFDIPEYTGDVTGLGTARLLEALRTSGLSTKFYQASSSELYGKTTGKTQNEETPFYPRSPYACAKAYSFYLTRNYRESYNMYAVNGILFNHESPRRGENFVTRKITLSIARILAGMQEQMLLGNLEAKRDWGYAPEYVEGMWQMMQMQKPEDYVLATGKVHTVREFLEHCLQHAKIDFRKEGEGQEEKYIDAKTGKAIVAINPHYYRPAEVDYLCGNSTKAIKAFNWKPHTDLETLAKIMVEEDCRILGVKI